MSPLRSRLIFLCGLSGSGKSTALRAFEDLGYYCVDNLPIPLLGHFVEFLVGRLKESTSSGDVFNYALLADYHDEGAFSSLESAMARLKAEGAEVELVFCDCHDDVILRRFQETRRPHPLLVEGTQNQTLREALVRERELLADFRGRADHVIDTSSFSPHELRRAIGELIGRRNSLETTILSFGFKYGVPSNADLVADVRFLPNPHFVPELRESTGNDQAVYEYVFLGHDAERFVDKYDEFLRFLLPLYEMEGKHYLTVGIGCTGGKHRSVAVARALHKKLEDFGTPVKLKHRDIEHSF